MPELEKEIADLKKELSKLAEEVTKLKELKEARPEKLPAHMPKEVAEILGFMEQKLGDKPEAGIAFFGGIQRKDGKIKSSYFSGWDFKDILKCSPKRMAKLLSPFSNEQRIQILKMLLEGDKVSSELIQTTGLEGGQLYHHLKELALAEYIEQKERGIYTLTEKGYMALLTISCMACTLEKTVIPEEVETTFWETRKKEKGEE